jgi:hypothetical protein
MKRRMDTATTIQRGRDRRIERGMEQPFLADHIGPMCSEPVITMAKSRPSSGIGEL